MMFASIQSKDIPWRVGQAIEVAAIRTEPSVHIVRREFHQHNPPNPILVAFREERRQYHFESDREYLGWWLKDTVVNGWPSVYHHEIDHAQKVLNRLAALTKEQA